MLRNLLNERFLLQKYGLLAERGLLILLTTKRIHNCLEPRVGALSLFNLAHGVRQSGLECQAPRSQVNFCRIVEVK